MKEWKIGYILTYTLEDASYLGGLMIIDSDGIPLEFAYTENIKPTKIQRILYGQSLEKYIKREIILGNLINHVKVKADLLITPEDNLSELKNLTGYPVISINQTSLAPLMEVGTTQEISKGEFILQASPAGSPLRIKLSEPNDENRRKAEAIILEVGKSMDLVEPITRVEGALKSIWEKNLE